MIRQIMRKTTRKQSGFSLIEISIVLVIVGLLLGGMMMPLSTQMEKSRRNDTRAMIDQAFEAIYGYALMNGRLPCPDTSGNGMENRSGGNCTSVNGGLPWASLGTANADAWGQTFSYRVTNAYADTVDGTGCGSATFGVSFSLCSNGDIQVLDARSGGQMASNVPAIIFSRGKNWTRAPSNDEAENTDNDAIFVSKNYSSVAGSEFDDLIVWMVPGILSNRMVNAGRLP